MTTGFVINHVWQSSCVALLASLLAFMLRKNAATVRYWVWLSASLKFLAPFALLVSLGGMIKWPAQRAISDPLPAFASTIIQIAEPVPSPSYSAVPVHVPARLVQIVIGVVWAFGFAAITFVRCRSWFRIWTALRSSTSVELPIPIPAFVAPGAEEPGIVGFLRPVLVLPANLLERLNPRQLDAVLAHELCHVRRRDNLFAAIHMVVEAIFWFHPLVWWIGSRMVEERELACDEEVLRIGCEPTDYVEGILKVCRFYKESSLPCVSGVTGADVKKRLRVLLAGSIAHELTARKKLILAATGLAVLSVPFVIGVLAAPAIRAQNAPANTPKFEVASVKPDDPSDKPGVLRAAGGGRLDLGGVTVKMLIEQAYRVSGYRIYGGPSWLDSARFSIVAKAAGEAANLTLDDMRPMLQTLLEDRFQLVVHREEKELPLFRLVVSKNGPKFKGSTASGLPQSRMGRGRIADDKASLDTLAAQLGQQLGRFVANQTGLAGNFDFHMEWTPDPGENEGGDSDSPRAGADGPSIFTALQEQLGLKLESGRGPVEVIVIDRLLKPDPD